MKQYLYSSRVFKNRNDQSCLHLHKNWLTILILSSFLFFSTYSPSPAAEQPQNNNNTNNSESSEKVNQNTVSIITGNPNGTYLQVAYDMAVVLDNGEELRVLPVVGQGSYQNIRDVRYLKGIDIGLTKTDSLNHARETKEFGDIKDKIVYIAKLFNEELHILARSEITAIEQLRGKKVNLGEAGSGTNLSTRQIFKAIGLEVEEVNMGQADAVEKIKSGEIQATVLLAAKPAKIISGIKKSDNLRLLPFLYTESLQNSYLPTTLTNADYPGVIADNQKIETIAVGTVLIAYNWPENSDRYRRLEKFVDALFTKISEFHKDPRHPKWREVNLASSVKGWNRFKPAQLAVSKMGEASSSVTINKKAFQQFMNQQPNKKLNVSELNETERTALYNKFLQWMKENKEKN